MKRSILILSFINWENKLLHRGHMLAKYFSKKGFEVYYIQKENVNASNFRGLAPKVYKDKGVIVVSLPALPYMQGKASFAYSLNDKILTRYLKKLLNELGDPILIMESPYWSKAADESRSKKGILCYDISDDYLEFATNEKWKGHLMRYEKHALEVSDIVFITSEKLRDKVPNGKPVYVVENGVDLEGFTSSADVLESHYKRPICGFIGGLYQWVDLHLIDKLAERYPNFTFVLVGPTDQMDNINKLCRRSNIHYLGEKDKGEIGDYFASLDVGLIPFVSEEDYPRLKTVNSNKVFQYCYFGYPVLSTEFQQVLGLKDIIEVCSSSEEFTEKLGTCIEEDSPYKIEIRKKYAWDNSWEKKVEDILKSIEKISLQGKD